MFRPVFLGAVLLAPALSLAAPSTLTAQGRLLDPAGGPVEGSPDLTFSIYDDAAASNPALWDETFQVVLAGGYYSAVLGSQQPLTATMLDTTETLWLGVSVDGGPELLPRQALMPTAYSVVSQTATNVSGGTVDATSVTADSVEATDIEASSSMLTTDLLATGTVSATTIEATGGVTAADIEATSSVVTADLLVTSSLSAASVESTGSVTASDVQASGSVSAADIEASGSVLASDILATGEVTAETVSATTVTATSLESDDILASQLVSDSVSTTTVTTNTASVGGQSVTAAKVSGWDATQSAWGTNGPTVGNEVERYVANGASGVTNLGAANGRRMCFLTRVQFHDTFRNESLGDCHVRISGGNWQLFANADNGDGDPDIRCTARCMTW